MRQPRPLTSIAKKLRKEMTDAEKVLWRELRAHRFEEYKFRRQEPFGSYVVDFVCHDSKLIVELDGGHHASQEQSDANRTLWLESEGYRVVRFWNNDVLTNIDGTLNVIEQSLRAPSPPVGEASQTRRMGFGMGRDAMQVALPANG